MEGSVLVIGGGIAGIQTSLDLTELGLKVYLVEKNPSIGGHMAQLDKLFPENDCSLCILAPKMVAVHRNPNIELLTLSEVTNVSGKAGNFSVTVRKNPRYVNEALCKGCGDCAAKCPKIETSNAFDMNLGKRKSIFIPFPQATPPVYMIDDKMCLYLNRNVCRVCEKVCKGKAIDFEQKPIEYNFNVGAIVIATGFEMLSKELNEKWGYEQKNVVNSLEYERILSPTGPFGNEVLRPSDETEPEKIAFVTLCETVPYCSRVCCMYTTEEAIATRTYSPNSEIIVFRHNIRVFGKNFYEYTKHSQTDHNIHYVNSKINTIEKDPETDDIVISYDDLTSGEKNKKYKANLTILAAPLVSSSGTQDLAKVFGLDLDDSGFFQDNSYFDKSLTSKTGVYLCGFCQGPMNISETVSNASAVASQISSFLKSERYTLTVESETELRPDEKVIKMTPRALIIGGGISGITAALNISHQGFETIIVEKEDRLGGNLNHLNLIYPAHHKASEFLDKKIKELYSNDKAKIYLNSTLKELEGSIGNYKVKIVNKEHTHEVNVGIIILATGSQEFKPFGLFQYNMENKNVITQSELEERLKQENTEWLNDIDHITTIMCVNSRQEGGYSYCSNICCSNTIKNINIVKELKPDLEVVVLFRELHIAKKEFEEYASNRTKIASYLKYSVDNKPKTTKVSENPEKYDIEVRSITDPDEIIEYKTDLIILSTPMIPPNGIQKLATELKIPIDENGFFIEAHKKLRPLDFTTHGIFVCGCAQWPKNIQDSISEANAAAGRASRFLMAKEISATKLEMLSFLLSLECFFKDMKVDTDKCNGCGKCAEACQFKAITLVDLNQNYEDVSISTKKAHINPAICKGCGKCSATCRLKAIEPRHYDFKQISSIIEPYFLEKYHRTELEQISLSE